MHVSHSSDLHLLERIVARDTTAIAELYDRHSSLLFSLIMRILRNRTDAEEVLQEVFVRVWTRAEMYDPTVGWPLPWLVRLARNRAIDRLRARRVRLAVDQPITETSVPPIEVSDDDTPSPETVVLDAERRETVMDALAGLRPEQRLLIEAAFFEGYTHTELAERFGLPLGTVKTRIRAGMLAMRGRLEQTV